MYMTGFEKVAAPSNQRNTLKMVVNSYSQVITCWSIFSCDDYVAKNIWVGLNDTGIKVMPG